MPNIPITIALEEDELLYSWVSRTAYANGFSHIRLFYNAYITPNATDSQKKRKTPQFELFSECAQIYESLNMQDTWSLSHFFLLTGIYQFYVPLMMSEQQNNILAVAFPDSFGDEITSISTQRLIPKLQYCPLCAKEDIQKTGNIVYRRSHHLPGVTVCWKHKVSLITYKGVILHETEPVGFEENIVPASEYEISYAIFAKDFFKHADRFNYKHIKNLISDAIQNGYITKKSLLDAHKSKLNGDIRNLFGPFQAGMYMDPINTLLLLEYLYKNVSTIPTADSVKCQLKCIQILRDNKCLLAEDYNPFLLQIYTPEEKKLLVNPSAIDDSWNISNNKEHSHQKPVSFNITDNKTLEKAIQELTGDEYSLVGNFTQMNTSVEIKHNTCGHIQKIKPGSFIEGKRCKHCNQIIRNELFPSIVSSLSDGEYRIIAKRSTNRYALENTHTGKRIVLQKQIILQELRRPTPSLLLPLKKKGVENKINFNYENQLAYINQTIPDNEPVFTDELTGSGYSYILSKRYMGTLTKKGFFKRMAPGVYVRKGIDLSTDDIIHCRYVNRHGKQIGYYTSASALYYFGVIGKPDTYSVATNIETTNNVHGRTTRFLGQKLRIRGTQVKIDNENWRQIMLLDLLSNFRKYLHSFDENIALSILRQYAKENGITYISLSKYIPMFPSSSGFARKLYMEE